MLMNFVAKNLNGSISCEFDFHSDLNIITGKNGSGKTTILKAMYCLLAGSIEVIARETNFDILSLTTEQSTVRIERIDDEQFVLSYRAGKADESTKLPLSDLIQESQFVRSCNYALAVTNGSIFFPTFRRIEGGFTMGEMSARTAAAPPRSANTRNLAAHFSGTGPESGDLIQRGLTALSQRMSLGNHTFVSSISTVDIVALLTTKYAAISETTNRIHQELSQEIFSLIGKYDDFTRRALSEQLQQATSTLAAIKERVNRFNNFSNEALRPFTTLSEIVREIFQDKGIAVSENIVLGDINNTIRSQILSSGEKHMLSFLCYNAFSENITVFIDEPEISLHADWQRILFPTLLRQGTNNQFVIATHSPFIYSKYPERELVLHRDRGGGLDATS
jgi:predicted ATP-dependent endonuclease of OLD family